MSRTLTENERIQAKENRPKHQEGGMFQAVSSRKNGRLQIIDYPQPDYKLVDGIV